MNARPRRFGALLGCMAVLAGAVLARANPPAVAEIVAVHVAAIGGADRLAELTACQAIGRVTTGGETLSFTMTAARPNRLRMEYRYRDGTLVQATDGKNPPWELDTRTHPTRNRLMSTSAAAAFLAGADFDDPLVAAQKRGDTIEYAGETTVDDRPMLRLLVTQRLSKSFFLLLDAQTYLIVSRLDPKPAAGMERVETLTEYRAYRPVNGVLAAHAVTVWVNGKITEEATLDRIEPNPPLSSDAFARPKS